ARAVDEVRPEPGLVGDLDEVAHARVLARGVDVELANAFGGASQPRQHRVKAVDQHDRSWCQRRRLRRAPAAAAAAAGAAPRPRAARRSARACLTLSLFGLAALRALPPAAFEPAFDGCARP